jgi:hypothetical protein
MKKAEILTLLRETRERMDRGTEYFAGHRDLVGRLDAAIVALTPPEAPPIVWAEHVTQERGPLKSVITRRSWEGTDGDGYSTIRLVEGGIFWLVGEEAPHHFATLEEAKAAGEERIRKYAQQIRCPECGLLFDGDDE